MWRDLSPYPRRLVQPTASSPHVLVVGAGVTGLVTAWVLLDKGYRVTIVSKAFVNFSGGDRLTSQIAGALWEFPPAVCGAHTDRISLSNSKRWCMVAYHAWDAIAAVPELRRASGVRMLPSGFFFPAPVEADPAHLAKMLEIMSSGVRGFRHDGRLVAERMVDPGYGVRDAYELLAPVIDTDQAMVWLTSLVLGKGAATVTEEIAADLLAAEDALRARFGADAIVNATGLSAAELAADATCYPVRGALARVLNDGRDFPRVESALAITADAARGTDGGAGEIVFLVPRNDNVLLVGGMTQAHEAALDLTLDAPAVARMRRRCEAFLPCLKNARLDPVYPLAQGLRPFRSRNVRVERELRPNPATGRPSRVVHSYGHGGSGWTLSFGCAADVVGLLEEALRDATPTPMEMDPAFADDSEWDASTSASGSVAKSGSEQEASGVSVI